MVSGWYLLDILDSLYRSMVLNDIDSTTDSYTGPIEIPVNNPMVLNQG